MLVEYGFEILLVNDTSLDNSAYICRNLVKEYPGMVKFINLSRNFSEHSTVMAGLNCVTGELKRVIKILLIVAVIY